MHINLESQHARNYLWTGEWSAVWAVRQRTDMSQVKVTASKRAKRGMLKACQFHACWFCLYSTRHRHNSKFDSMGNPAHLTCFSTAKKKAFPNFNRTCRCFSLWLRTENLPLDNSTCKQRKPVSLVKPPRHAVGAVPRHHHGDTEPEKLKGEVICGVYLVVEQCVPPLWSPCSGINEMPLPYERYTLNSGTRVFWRQSSNSTGSAFVSLWSEELLSISVR